MVDVFISYKQDEREAVQIIADALAELRLDVWFDTKLRAGGSFDEEIAAALNAAKAVLVCWTPAAMRSEWVRAEATEGLRTQRLVACFLQPTDFIPPFNLLHAENLSAWAGQPDDPAWLKLLERIGELVNRPGLAAYHAVMRPGVAVEQMRTWCAANGADPLVDSVWARVALVEGEGATERLAREKAEARIAAERRAAQTEKSRRLARERGLRDPVRERRRFLALAASVIAVAVLSIFAVVYFNDAQGRDRALRDDVASPAQARAFLAANSWHPIAGRAREKFERLDAEAWLTARTDGSIRALEIYIADAETTPQGKFLAQARDMLAAAQQVRHVQTLLARMRLYDGPASGAYDSATQRAIALFRYQWNMPVSAAIDAALLQQLDTALTWWMHPRLDELHARTRDPPSEADYVKFAGSLGVDAATIRALIDVESGPRAPAFDDEGRMTMVFEPSVFSRLTERRYDSVHPELFGRPVPKAAQWDRLSQAFALDPDAALKSASWGRLQILGLNHGRAGYETVGEFVRVMSQSEANQLEAGFLGFLKTPSFATALDALRRRDWAQFARRWSGSASSQYPRRLEAAYRRNADEIAARTASPTPVPAVAAPSAMPPSAPLAVRPPRAAPAASTDTTEQGTAGAAAAGTVAERVKKIVTEQLGVDADKVTPQAGFDMDLGTDDGDKRDLVMAFEAEFGIEIPESVARTIITVGDATRAIEKILADEKKQ